MAPGPAPPPSRAKMAGDVLTMGHLEFGHLLRSLHDPDQGRGFILEGVRGDQIDLASAGVEDRGGNFLEQ